MEQHQKHTLMSKSINILDNEYIQWVKRLAERYRKCQIKAAIKVNAEQLGFYWLLGHDIVEMHVEERWGERVIEQLSKDLKAEMPGVEGLSVTNLRYCRRFYLLYSEATGFRPQLGGEIPGSALEEIHPQVGGELNQPSDSQPSENIFAIPWGHHKLIMDKVKGNVDKALFFVRQTVENGWSRAMLLNWIDTSLYERQGKALTNFRQTLPEEMSDLAQELTKDPYDFAFAGITGRYNEQLLKDKLLNNITTFLIELGTGFAYVGKEYRLQMGETEGFIDLLFYNLNLSCYVVVEVKTGKFQPKDIGQLGTYVVACNHLLRKPERDNPTIGLLVCKERDRVQAQYALESSSQPIGVSEYDLERFYPEKVEGVVPTIEEIENKLNTKDDDNR